MSSKQFTLPKTLSPFYKNIKRIPRKLKKQIKKDKINWKDLTNEQRLWYYLGTINPKYKQFLIDNI